LLLVPPDAADTTNSCPYCEKKDVSLAGVNGGEVFIPTPKLSQIDADLLQATSWSTRLFYAADRAARELYRRIKSRSPFSQSLRLFY